MGPLRILLIVLAALALSPRAWAGPPAVTAKAVAATAAAASAVRDEVEEKVAPDSPRASLADYLQLARDLRWAEAARYLELPRGVKAEDAERLARRLDAVLRRRLLLDLEDVSPQSEGTSVDGLPVGVDEIGRIPVRGAARGEPVRLVRRMDADGVGRWEFSFATVERIDKWYDLLDDRWLRERLPAWALRTGPKDLLYWQWIALPLLAALAWLFGVALTRLVRPLFDRLASQDDDGRSTPYRNALRTPARLLIALGVLTAAAPLLALDRTASSSFRGVIRTVFELGVFWTAVRIVDTGSRSASTSAWGRTHPAGAALMPIVGKVAKIALFALASIALLSELGFAVGSIIAGLGIGGLAFALAAQKTVENLFGGVSIGIDQPFRIGDYVTVDGLVSGTVIALGLRSTRIRTDARTVVSIPNGKLAEMRIENHGARDRYRLNTVLPLASNTPADALRAIAGALEGHLRGLEGFVDEDFWVVLKEFTRDSVDLEVSAHYELPDMATFRSLRRAALLRAADIVAQHGGAFAQVDRK